MLLWLWVMLCSCKDYWFSFVVLVGKLTCLKTANSLLGSNSNISSAILSVAGLFAVCPVHAGCRSQLEICTYCVHRTVTHLLWLFSSWDFPLLLSRSCDWFIMPEILKVSIRILAASFMLTASCSWSKSSKKWESHAMLFPLSKCQHLFRICLNFVHSLEPCIF